ncbi:MAG: hypothetical protein EOP87_17385 [Verrucomicrobiaceae bacterium]|nr:MAG: hypothetical protein EOP87_17385 [Verrucomicrobiaceae bacterium]
MAEGGFLRACGIGEGGGEWWELLGRAAFAGLAGELHAVVGAIGGWLVREGDEGFSRLLGEVGFEEVLDPAFDDVIDVFFPEKEDELDGVLTAEEGAGGFLGELVAFGVTLLRALVGIEFLEGEPAFFELDELWGVADGWWQKRGWLILGLRSLLSLPRSPRCGG